MPSLDISVVIGFRDWGVERLRRSVTSLHAAYEGLDGEVIISDYGSTDPSLSREVADAAGARWVHTPGDPVWSRSRALNAGFALAEGSLLVSTDADMLFAPGTLEAVYAEASAAAPCAVFLQCRDLPEDLPEEYFEDLSSVPWEEIERRSRLRPRWGMGGMMVIDREGFNLLHGFDERLHTYGREDLDFALRARRAGRRTHWVQSSRARMYHMWHPPTLNAMQATKEGKQAIARNRNLVESDLTTSRNITSAVAPLNDGVPLVSIIVLDVHDASDLHRTAATALAQSVRNVEVIVCDSGPGVVPPVLDDQRLRWLRLSDDGAIGPLAEIFAQCRGTYVSVVHCGDLLPLDRTERLLGAVVQGDAGAFGRLAIADHDGTIVISPPLENARSMLLRRDAVRAVADTIGDPDAVAASIGDLLRRAGFRLGQIDSPALLTQHRATLDSRGWEPLSETQTEPLRILLPEGHRGAVERVAQLRSVQAGLSDLVLDGTVNREEIRHGKEIISGGLTVRNASYLDLMTLARAGDDLMLVAATEMPSANSSSWIDQIVEHALEQGATLPIELRRVDGAEAWGTSPGVYVVRGADLAFSVQTRSIRSEGTEGVSKDSGHPWILLGADIGEVWA